MSNPSWSLDPTHSEIGFKVKHMMFTNVSGQFTDFAVTWQGGDDDFTHSKVTFEAEIASINTNNPDRDNHLRSGDFFDAAAFPKLSFVSDSIEKSGDGYVLKGNLTIKGNTRPVALNVEYSGLMKDPWGNTKAGFSVEGKINRKDFGLNWNAALETGGVLVGEEVKLHAELQLVRS